MNTNFSRVHRFNAVIMWFFSIILTVSSFFNGGISQALRCLIATAAVSSIVTVLAFIKFNDTIKCIVIPLLPAIGSLGYSAFYGGKENMFGAYFVCACLAALYFRRNVIVAYGSVLSLVLIAAYIMNPAYILGKATGFGEFLTRFGFFICCNITLYFLATWGNEHLNKAENANKKASVLNENLTEMMKQVNYTAESLFESVEKCNQNLSENQRGVASVSRSIQEISKATEDSAISVNAVNSYVIDSSEILDNTYSLSKEVESEFANMRVQLESLAAASEENSASTQEILSMTMLQDDSIGNTATMMGQIRGLGDTLKNQTA